MKTNKIKILVIEDKYKDIKKIIETYEGNSDVEILPNVNNTVPKGNNNKEEKYKNQAYLRGIYTSDNFLSQMGTLIEDIPDIDLFIVDISLIKDDILGIEFLNFFGPKKETYHNGKSSIIIISGFGKESNQVKQLDDPTILDTHIHKDQTGDYLEKLQKFINDKFSVKPTGPGGKNEKTFWKEFWIDPIGISEKYFDRFVLIFIGILFIIGIFFAVFGISKEFCAYFFPNNAKKDLPISEYNLSFAPPLLNVKHLSIDSVNNENKNSTPSKKIDSLNNENKNGIPAKKQEDGSHDDETEILSVVEHIFLYLIPLFLFFGLYNYYTSTTRVKLKGGSDGDIDYGEAVKGVNTSKIILLSSLLSFAIIKGIEKIFIDGVKDYLNLIAYCVFIIILMVFIFLLHKVERHDVKKEGKVKNVSPKKEDENDSGEQKK